MMKEERMDRRNEEETGTEDGSDEEEKNGT